MTNSNTIEAISSSGKKINVDINKLLENIPLYEFYKTGFTENFTPSNGVFYDFDIGVARDVCGHEQLRLHGVNTLVHRNALFRASVLDRLEHGVQRRVTI